MPPARDTPLFATSLVLGWFSGPMFVFIVGCVLAMSVARRRQAGQPTMRVAWHVVTRAALIFLGVPERRDEAEAGQRVGQIEGLKVIYRDRFFWRVAPLTFICQATQLAILGLWSGPWLRDVAGLDRAGVAFLALTGS